MAPRAEAETTESEPLTAVQEAAMGNSLDAYREAKKAEADAPLASKEQVEPAKVEARTDVRPATQEPRKSRRERDQDAANARTQKAVEAATTDLRKELDELKKSIPARETRAAEPARSEPVRERSAAPAATQDDYDRYLSMPNAPKLEDFRTAGKSYEQFIAATQLFIADARDTERAQRTAAEHEHATRFDQERARASKLKTAFDGDPDVQALFKVVQETKQWPDNAVLSRDVLGLQTFYQLETENAARKAKGEAERPASAYHAIAEEIASSDHPLALAKHLSKPGELARLAALPDARSLLRAIRDIERDITTQKPVKTRTSAGEPAITLTSARATDPLDPVESALRSGNQSDYKRARTEERLRERGLLK